MDSIKNKDNHRRLIIFSRHSKNFRHMPHRRPEPMKSDRYLQYKELHRTMDFVVFSGATLSVYISECSTIYKGVIKKL